MSTQKKIVIDKNYLPHQPGDTFSPPSDMELWITDSLLKEISAGKRDDLFPFLKDKNIKALEAPTDLLQYEFENSKAISTPISDKLTKGLRQYLNLNKPLPERDEDKNKVELFQDMCRKCKSLEINDVIKLVIKELEAEYQSKFQVSSIKQNWFLYQYSKVLSEGVTNLNKLGTPSSNPAKVQNNMRDLDYLPYLHYADGFASNDKKLIGIAKKIYPKIQIIKIK